MKNDDFGDRMKEYERSRTSESLIPGNVFYARLDGRGFSKFTKGMLRPFDPTMSHAMIETTKLLVDKTHAKMGYTQSDEISLIWNLDDPKSQMMFDGKIQKLTSVLAAMATAKFSYEIANSSLSSYAEKLPHFDCRVFELPSLSEGANAILWRVQDAQRNAVSMAAHTIFGHKPLIGKKTSEKIEMLAERGIDFYTEYPDAFRNGAFIRRVSKEVPISDVSIIPEHIRKMLPENQKVIRHKVEQVYMPPFGRVINKVGVIFNEDLPVAGSLNE